VLAWLTAGALDIISAFVYQGLGPSHTTPFAVLRAVASGPFGEPIKEAGALGALVGLGVHFALMANMTTVFVLACGFFPLLRRQPVATGLAYGLLLYLTMYFVVLPLRYPGFVPHNPVNIAEQLFSHIVLVGLSMSLIAMKGFKIRNNG
jgi:hypothetical protein